MRALWLTNDLPPRVGGIQQFLGNLLGRVEPDGAVVVGPSQRGARGWDRDQPFEVVRAPTSVLLPTPGTLRLVRDVARAHRPDVLVLGASWPLGELGPMLARDPGVPIVALTHGLEAGLTAVGLGHLVRRATRACGLVTTISGWAEERLRPHVPVRLERVPPGVDTRLFHPDLDGHALRERWGVPADAPLVGCISRLVRRKGQDALVAAWPGIRARHPDAWLVLVGTGPMARTLRGAIDAQGPHAQVVLAGEVSWTDLPAAYAALDLFAMPCRTRRLGTDVEGLGIVYLEAQACGVAAVAGRSGGAPEAVVDGRTGRVVDGTDPSAVGTAVSRLLDDPERLRDLGASGRRWVEERWDWDRIAERFRGLLDEVV